MRLACSAICRSRSASSRRKRSTSCFRRSWASCRCCRLGRDTRHTVRRSDQVVQPPELLHKIFVVLVSLVVPILVPAVEAQTRPDFSGTWRWTSRAVSYPLVIRQTADELTIETRGLPQGPPTETFRLDGVHKTTVL